MKVSSVEITNSAYGWLVEVCDGASAFTTKFKVPEFAESFAAGQAKRLKCDVTGNTPLIEDPSSKLTFDGPIESDVHFLLKAVSVACRNDAPPREVLNDLMNFVDLSRLMHRKIRGK